MTYILHNTFEVLDRSWYKRRCPKKEREDKIVHLSIPEYKEEHNHFCNMFVEYASGRKENYISRVVYNSIKDYWTVDGMHVAVRVLCTK